MADIKPQTLAIAAGLGVAALLALYIAKKGVAGAVAGAVGAAGDAAVGTVYGIGDFIGIPRTNETECARAKREGRTWDASFACPAGDFLGYLFKPAETDSETARLLARYPAPVDTYAGYGDLPGYYGPAPALPM